METGTEAPATRPGGASAEGAAGGAAPAGVEDPYPRIVQSARSAASRSRFLAEVTQCVGAHFRSPYTAVHVRYPSEIIQDDWHTGPTDPRFWKPSVQQFLTECLAASGARAKLLRSKSGQTRAAFLYAPIFDPGGPAIGGMALVVVDVEESKLTQSLVTLETLCRLASFCVEFLGARPGEGSGSSPPNRALARAARCESAVELAFAITNELRNKLNCVQAGLGLVGRRSQARILSISGLDHVAKQSPGVASLRAAMEECLDANATLVYQRRGDWSDDPTAPVFALHKQWHAAAKGDAVASIPLCVDGSPAAVVSLRKRSDQAFTSEELERVRGWAEPFAPALLLADRAGRSLPRHVLHSVHQGIAALVTPGHVGRKIATAAIALGMLWFCFGTMSYEVAARSVVTPARVRHLAAPFEGVLASASVVAGDRVQAGEVLCALDDRDLRQQEAELVAELAMLEREKDRARAKDSPVEVQLAEANQELVRARLAIVRNRLERSVVRAPFGGIVVSGDLRKAVGSVVEQGAPLFAVARGDRWMLELEVPQHAMGEVTSAASGPEALGGAFAAYARPEAVRRFTVDRLLPAAQSREQRTVYVVEAELRAGDEWIRPGMEGLAKIEVGRRRVWWLALHRALDYVRITFWL